MTSIGRRARRGAGISGLLAAIGCGLGAPSEVQAADVVVFRDVRVFDGSKATPGMTVVVEDGRIARVGAGIAAPAGATVVDGRGKTLLPGLIDAHTHTFDDAQLRQAAVFGVTTELDMFGLPAFAALKRAEQKTPGKATDRADLYSAGTLVTAPGGHGTEYGFPIPTIERADQAAAFVDARIADGSDYIKIVYDDGHEINLPWPTIDRSTLAAVIKAAHSRGKKAVVHVLARESARAALVEGADGLVHLFVDEPIDDDLVKRAVEAHAFIIPTLTVLESIDGIVGAGSLVDDPSLSAFLTPDDARSLKAKFPGPSASAEVRAIPPKAALRLKRAGVPILAGTDVPNPGTSHGASVHRELELLVAAGLSPAEALEAATSATARAFGLADRGRIAPKLVADLVLVEGDPTVEIKATRRVVGVWKRGMAIDRDAYKATVLALAREALKPAEAPSGSKTGLVSDFEGGKVASAFGSGWSSSTDSFVGGKSKAEFVVVPGGASASKFSMKIAGTIQDRPQPRWAGAMFSPGKAPMAPLDLSARKAIAFWARGDGKPATIMLFSRSKGFMPSAKVFETGKDWARHRLELKDFDGTDGKDLFGVFFGGGGEVGPFEFQVDEIQFE